MFLFLCAYILKIFWKPMAYNLRRIYIYKQNGVCSDSYNTIYIHKQCIYNDTHESPPYNNN